MSTVTLRTSNDQTPVQRSVSPEEWWTRVDLAACYRLVDLYGMSDMVANHISARVPGEAGAFLINPYGMLYEEITASNLLKINLEGNILAQADPHYGVNHAGFVIHSAIHRERRDVDCVIHTHTAAGMAVSALECGLVPMTQTGMRFARAAYHNYEGVVLNLDEQARLTAALGDGDLLVLRNHGMLVAAATIPQAFNLIHRVELACRSQLDALATGQKIVLPSAQVIDETWRNYQPGTRRPFGILEWPALIRKLDRIDPSFRN